MRHVPAFGTALFATLLLLACSSEGPTPPQNMTGITAGTGPGAGTAGTEGGAGVGEPTAGSGWEMPTAGTGWQPPTAGTGPEAGAGGAGGAGDAGEGGEGGSGDAGAGGTGGGAGGGIGERGPDPTVKSATDPGPFSHKTYTNGFRQGPDFGGGTIHYPEGAEPPFASVVVVPGYLSAESTIKPWGPFLASHGIVTFTIATKAPGDYPALRAKALMDAIVTLEAENTRDGSPLKGKLSLDHFGVMGWSMGGGGTLIAARDNPTKLKAAISLCGWEQNKNFSTNKVPHLFFAGQSDSIAPANSHAKPHYDGLPSTTPKMYFEVRNGSHSVANNPNGGSGEVGRYGLSWMKVFLEGDMRYMQFLEQSPSSTSRFFDNL